MRTWMAKISTFAVQPRFNTDDAGMVRVSGGAFYMQMVEIFFHGMESNQCECDSLCKGMRYVRGKGDMVRLNVK